MNVLALLVSATLLPIAAGAQPYATPPPPGPPRPLTIAAPSELALPNGLRVVVARREGVPLITAVLVVLSGSEADPPQLAGLASMTAGLLTQGTRRHTAPEIAASAEALGGSLESGAGWSQSLVSITVTTPKLDAALGLVAEVAREPTFAQEEIDRLRTQTLDGLEVGYANPGTMAGLAAVRMAYGSSPWGHPASGTPASLRRIGRDDLLALHHAAFRPDRAVLILAGDIDRDTALALASAHFRDWAAPARAALVAPPVPQAAAGPELAVIDMPGAGQAGVALALPLPVRQGADWATGAVMNAILGGGYSSRLMQEIRIKRGLSYDAGSSIAPRRDSALLQAAMQTKNESAAEVVGLLQGELDRIMQSPVGADELAARKATLIGGFSRSVETTAGLAGAIRALVVTGQPPAELKARIETLQAVDADAVQRYAAAHLGAGQRRIAVAGVAGRFRAALEEAVPGLVVIPPGKLDLEGGAGIVRE